MAFTVAIIGRPNVGKSTLFNRLVGKRLALVDDTPGLTRDRREGEAQLGPLHFRIIDTAGLEEVGEETLEGRMLAQTEAALETADLALMLIDARAGVTPVDAYFSDWLRRRSMPVILVANKCEGKAGDAGLAEAYALGLGEPLPLSASHGDGLVELHDAIAAHAPDSDDDGATSDARGPLRLAILGRPNAGKSTLINYLIGEERMITGPEPGITRDAIAIPWTWHDQPIRLFDTAGLRRRARIDDRLEKLSASDAMRAMAFAEVVVLLSEAAAPLERQDLTIARKVTEEGRALVIALSKWDLVRDRRSILAAARETLETSLPQVKGVPLVTVSGRTGDGVARLMSAVLAVYERWQRRVPTASLNRWLDEMVMRHPPPLAPGGRRLRLRYMTQAKGRPPTFVIFANRPSALAESYQRYLQNGLREAFDLDGVPIRIRLRKSENPYART
jgi:GTP-binding protein